MAHDLVIGGSGMLAGLVEKMADGSRTVSVVARNPRRLEQLAVRASGVQPLACNYENSANLHEIIADAVAQNGPIERAVCWIHSTAPDAMPIVAPFVSGTLVHLFGSAAADPSNPALLEGWQHKFEGMPLNYKQVVLGFVREGSTSRWLTHDEICSGVEKALNGNDQLTIIGTVTPWDAHP